MLDGTYRRFRQSSRQLRDTRDAPTNEIRSKNRNYSGAANTYKAVNGLTPARF